MTKLVLIIFSIFLLGGCETVFYSVSSKELEPYLKAIKERDQLRYSARNGNDIISLPQEQFDLGQIVLSLCAPQATAEDISAQLDRIDQLSAELAFRLNGKTSARDKINTLCDFVWIKGFHCPHPLWEDYSAKEYVDLWQLDYSNFNQLLKNHEGNCLSLTILYLALAERVGLPLYGVVIPNHIFVRYDDGHEQFNIETTDNGNIYSDKDYRSLFMNNTRFLGSTFYLKNLTKKQVVGCLLSNIGAMYKKRNNYKKALDTHLLALQSNFDDPTLLYSIANEYLLLADLDHAEHFYEQALAEFPRQPFVYAQLGYISWIKKRYQQSLQYLEHAEKLLVFDETARSRIVGEDEKTSFTQTCLAMTHNYLGNVYLDMGDPHRALEHAEEALKIWNFKRQIVQYYNFNSVADIYRTFGRIYLVLDEPENAINYYKLALQQLNSTTNEPMTKKLEAIILMELGNSHKRLGASDEAEKYFMKAHDIFRSLDDSSGYLKVLRLTLNPEQ